MAAVFRVNQNDAPIGATLQRQVHAGLVLILRQQNKKPLLAIRGYKGIMHLRRLADITAKQARFDCATILFLNGPSNRK